MNVSCEIPKYRVMSDIAVRINVRNQSILHRTEAGNVLSFMYSEFSFINVRRRMYASLASCPAHKGLRLCCFPFSVLSQ